MSESEWVMQVFSVIYNQISPPLTTLVLFANSLDPDETPSIRVTINGHLAEVSMKFHVLFSTTFSKAFKPVNQFFWISIQAIVGIFWKQTYLMRSCRHFQVWLWSWSGLFLPIQSISKTMTLLLLLETNDQLSVRQRTLINKNNYMHM